MNAENLKTSIIGASGLASSKVVEIAEFPTLESLESGFGIVTQIVILLATLIGLFRKKPKNDPSKIDDDVIELNAKKR